MAIFFKPSIKALLAIKSKHCHAWSLITFSYPISLKPDVWGILKMEKPFKAFYWSNLFRGRTINNSKENIITN